MCSGVVSHEFTGRPARQGRERSFRETHRTVLDQRLALRSRQSSRCARKQTPSSSFEQDETKGIRRKGETDRCEWAEHSGTRTSIEQRAD